mmetsp:Transcript_29418/g.77070  ORF Transcript_29418/g.77070 Transcript_29418/m.77070 type:complete len:401 (+) Transcript_29418:45-1247(+)
MPASAVLKRKTPQELVSWLQRGALDEQVEALGLLEALAAQERPRSESIASGAARALLGFLPLGSADRSAHVAETRLAAEARLLAVKTLEHLARASAGRATILSAGGVAALVGLLFGDPPEGSMQSAAREQAVLALRNVAGSGPTGRERVIKDGGLPPLVELLSGAAPSCRIAAAGALQAIAGSAQHSSLVVEAGALPPLMDLLKASKVECRTQAAAVLRSLACTDGNRNAIMELGPLPQLVNMLSDETAQAQAEAAGALAALATIEELVPTVEELSKEEFTRPPHPDTRQIVAAGAVEPLVALLSTGSAEGRGNAAAALCQLTELSRSGRRHHDAIVQAGALTPLVVLLADAQDARSRAWAAGALRHLAASVDEQQIEHSIPPTRGSRDAIMQTIRSYCL